MRSFIVFTGILVLAAQANAQSTTTTTAAAAAEEPPLIKSVVEDPNDSPMVRAAKRAVASRQNAKQRRVISVTPGGTPTRGRMAISSGSVEGPRVPPPSPPQAQQAPQVRVPTQQEIAAHRAKVEARLKQLEAEEGPLSNEADQQYGDEMDEDYVEKRLTEIAAERKKLLESLNSPPPPR